jgi:hypothetical protein
MLVNLSVLAKSLQYLQNVLGFSDNKGCLPALEISMNMKKRGKQKNGDERKKLGIFVPTQIFM